MHAERDVYEIVRGFFASGRPPPSRNRAFELYQDPRFSRAVRIYHYLESVRRDLHRLVRQRLPFELDVIAERERVALRLSYRRGQVHRTAFLRRAEWEILRKDPVVAELLSRAAV